MVGRENAPDGKAQRYPSCAELRIFCAGMFAVLAYSSLAPSSLFGGTGTLRSARGASRCLVPRVSHGCVSVRCCAAVRCENARDVVVDSFSPQFHGHAIFSFARGNFGLPSGNKVTVRLETQTTNPIKKKKHWALSFNFGSCIMEVDCQVFFWIGGI